MNVECCQLKFYQQSFQDNLYPRLSIVRGMNNKVQLMDGDHCDWAAWSGAHPDVLTLVNKMLIDQTIFFEYP